MVNCSPTSIIVHKMVCITYPTPIYILIFKKKLYSQQFFFIWIYYINVILITFNPRWRYILCIMGNVILNKFEYEKKNLFLINRHEKCFFWSEKLQLRIILVLSWLLGMKSFKNHWMKVVEMFDGNVLNYIH